METSYVIVKTTSKTKKWLETRALNQLAEQAKLEPEKDRLKRTRTVSYVTGTQLMDKSKFTGRASGATREVIAETASKLADKT